MGLTNLTSRRLVVNTLAGIWSFVFVQMECVDGWCTWVLFPLYFVSCNLVVCLIWIWMLMLSWLWHRWLDLMAFCHVMIEKTVSCMRPGYR